MPSTQLAWIPEVVMFVKGAAMGGVAAKALEMDAAHNEMANGGTRKSENLLIKGVMLLIKRN